MSTTGNQPQRLKMKDLERLTGVGRETIRHYIREGLLPEPERPARNVAYYDQRFVTRLNLIKELQAKRFLPLNVIKSMLGDGEEQSVEEIRALMELDGRIFPQLEQTPDVPPETLAGLAKRTGVAVTEIRQLADVEALDITVRDGDQWIDEHGIRMVEHWAKLREAGYSDEIGMGPEALALHINFVRWLAREELKIFSGAITGRFDADTAAQMAETGITHVGNILTLLRRKVLLEYIAQGNLPESDDSAPSARPTAS